uniref:Spectrin repeat containing nuclear envelope protein 2 n=1 Tax=Podarcis muralis TaxID=64176 RepID=A0A670I6Q1_PODMU
EPTQHKTLLLYVGFILFHSPPSFVSDLYTDIGQGHVLLDLLEVLSGQQMPREKGSNTFQCRSNIENALTFLKNRSIKLINIHVADIIEGKPSIVLGLIWTIILHFHIEELAQTLACGYGHPSPDSSSAVDSSPTASPPAKRNAKAKERWKMSAKKALLLWAKEQCATHGSISVADFKSSWRNGLAFLAIIHALRPDLVDMERAKDRPNKENLEEAFEIAETELSIPRLLEPDDVDVVSPDEKSIMTYVAQFLQYFKSLPVAEDEMQMNEWKAKLDSLLPPPLDAIESWLQEVERQLAEDLPDSQDHCEAMAALEGKMRSTQSLMDHFKDHLEMLQSFENRDEAGMPLVPPQKLEEMRRRFSSIQLADFSNLVECHQLFCSAILKELVSKLNIWHIKHGTKENVESLLSDWNVSIISCFLLQVLKLFKMVESQVSRCNEYIDNVNATLRKILLSWDTYTENIRLLQAWLEDTRKKHPPNVFLAAWNSRHGSVNEAGNFLIESCNEEVGSAVSSELKKLNRKWAKLIKKTQFVSCRRYFLKSLSEEEVKLNFEDAHKELEASILKAMQILGQKTRVEPVLSPPYPLPNTPLNLLVLFVTVVSQHVSHILQAVRCEIVSYVELKMEIERGKLNNAFSKLNKQINKEKKLLKAGKTKGLIAEHEAIFSQQGVLGELHTSLQALKAMSKNMTEEEKQAEKKTPVVEYERKKEELQRQALAVHSELLSMAADSHSPKRGWVFFFLFSIFSIDFPEFLNKQTYIHLNSNCTKQCSLLEQGRRQRTEVDPKDWEEASAVAAEYKVRLGELGCKMQVIETILRDMETFLALLMHAKQSLGASVPLSLAPGSPGEAMLQEVSLIKREAKSLDERLKQVSIYINDDESGKKMCCEDLVAALPVNENPVVGSVEEQDSNQNREAQEEFTSKNSDLFKNIQDVHVKISKIGLREPTIPAVQQRLKSISELRQKLDRLAAEMRSLNEVASRLSRSANGQGEEVKRQWKLTEGLWKKTKLAIAEKQEHCARVMELLKQYHSCKNCLTGIIQKQEHTLSQQVSYMGKENLQRIIVNVVKQEFNNHSEDIDRINQIGKSLQSQLNKMKSLEDPPFENEANAIVDRWLDVNEWTENYCKNLERALALWDKLLNLSSSAEEWLNAELKKLDGGCLTEKELCLERSYLGLCNMVYENKPLRSSWALFIFLCKSSVSPLFQVIKSSLLNKMELIIKHLPNQSIPTELNGNTAELKEDLDLAKTQIGMTESLLRSLSPSNTLGIFAKLEEIHQKILQQKHHVKLLEKETSCLNPEVVELNKQLKSVTDLFDSKMQMFQDHFMTLLNYHCQDFCDWFSSTRLNLKECFDPSETKEILEEKIQRLATFLTFEGKGSAFQEVKTLLSQVESYFPEVDVSHMSRWMKSQEAELQSVISRCQGREKELHVTLQQFARLEYLFCSLEEWLSLQEKKWQENQVEKPRLEHFYQILLKQRESFDSLAWLANSLRLSGLSKEEVVLVTPQLVDRYKTLLTCVSESLDVSQVLSAEESNFEELAQNMIHWVQRLKDKILGLSSKESKAPLEESLEKIKEILQLKEEGDAKLQNIVCLGEHVKSKNGSKNLAVERMISDVRNQWESTIQMARGYLRQSSARKQKAKTSSLLDGDCLTTAEGSGSVVPDSDSVAASSWDELLQDIMSAKKARQAQLHLLNNYQACLTEVQSSMKHFSEEKENLKTVPLSEDTVLLENIQKCLDSIQKGRILLQKLKAEQGNLSRQLTRMDKELIQSQVAQIDQWWKQMEDTLKRKQIRVAAQANEFKVFMDKAQELQKLLQQQHCLRTGGDTHNQAHSALMATELQTLKNSVSMLKSGAEMQMKRMWTDTGKRALESAINDLQTRVEELEQLTPTEDAQRSGRYPQAYDLTKKIEEAVLWARVSLLHLDGKAALFPDDLMFEIESCKVLIGAAEEKKSGVVQLVDEAQRIAPQLESGEASALALLSDQLQTCYKDLVPKLVERLEQLESELGKRRQLFADTEKLQAKLKEAERVSKPGTGDTSLKSEMDRWHAVVEKSAKEIEEAKGIVDASPQGLNVFEKLFLNDFLRSLQSRTERAHRLNQINRRTAENKVDAYEKVTRTLMSLEQDLCSLQREELELDQAGVDQDIKGKLFVLKERAAAIQSGLLHLEKYKEIWECLHLKWDVPDLEKLQGECCKLKRKLEQRVSCSAEGDGRRTALSEVEALISIIQKHCDVLKDCSDSIASETSPMSEKTLSWKVQHARHLTQEALRLLGKSEAFGPSLKETKMQQIKSLGVKIDGLAQVIQSKILAVQEKCGHEQGFQSKLGHSLAALKQIKSELRQPILLDLETQTIRCENMYCKVIEDAAEVESCAAEDLINRKRGSQEGQSSLPDSLQRELDELQSLKVQLKSDIAARKVSNPRYLVYLVDLSAEILSAESYREAVLRASDLLSQREALFCTPLLALDELEEPSLLSRQRQEELESAMSQVEALTSAMENIVEPQAKLQLEKTLGDLVSKSLIAREQEQKRKSDVCLEKYNRFKKSKEVIHVNLNDVERVLQKSLYHIPVSYKEALEQSEQSKMMSSRLVSIEEDLRRLRQDSGQLVSMCSENDCVLIDTVVTTLWLKWLYLLDTAKEWEGKCEEQKQEWKSVSEEMERESIILDNLQEELPENPKEKERASKEELEEFLECTNIYGESVNAEKRLLRLILQRVRSILMVPECPSAEGGSLPVMNEIQTMQNRTKELFQKAQKQKDAVQSEIEERDKVNEEIGALKASLRDTESLLHETDLEPLNEKTAKLEVGKTSEIMDKLRIKYSEMYTIVPVEIETHLEDCKQTLQELEEKVTTESLKLSPHYTADKKIQEISKGLQAVENMLQQKSKSTARAKEIQKRIWDMLDLWHYKMNELDSEIQDLVEQDPGQQGQELMDRWMIPLQRYQQVSQRAERRTADLNRATSKMEECEELLKSTQVWLENTNRLLTEEAKSDSAKALNKHADALQMAFEDSEQKQSILSAIYPELEEFSSLIETGCTVQMLNKVNEQVKALQQKILEILPHIQHLADEVEAIESEVKKMEKDVDKIKTILSPSEDTLDLSPKEHLKHGQVIMAHISPMQKAIAEIQSYKESLRLPGMRMQPLSVFQRTKQLLKELKTLERITKEQNALLEVKGEEMEDVKQRISLLCQRKEDILTRMKNSLVELHQRPEQPELEEDILESPEPEEHGAGADWQVSGYRASVVVSLPQDHRGVEVAAEQFASICLSLPPLTPTTNTYMILSEGRRKNESGFTLPNIPVTSLCPNTEYELRVFSVSKLCSDLKKEGMINCLTFQAILSEIEQKVARLLEDCKDRHTGEGPGIHQEAESLSSKLRDVKCNLKRVQGMLQGKSTEEQPSEETEKQHLHIFQENVTGEVSLSLDQKLFELLLAISRCLNDMEQMLNTCELTSEEAPVQQMLYETLSAELQKLHADIGEKKDDLLRSIASAGGNADRFSECFSNLQSWLQSTQAAASSRSKSIKAELDQYSQYQNEIRRLYGRLIMKKSLLQESFGATSEHSISEQLQNLFQFQDVLDDLWEILQDKQKELTSPFISEQQYEALLQGLAELSDLGREKVAQEIKLKATSRTTLQFHLQNHKVLSFFCNKAHRQLVQICSEKMAPSGLHERGKEWSQLVEEYQCLEQQAVQHGAYLERLLQDWIAFDDGYGSFCQKLEALSSSVPSVGLVEETEERLMERTQLLQQIKMKMEGEQAGYCQVVKEGKNLMGLVNCPELQVQIEKLEDQWTSLSKRVAHELQRLETLLKLLSSYNRDSKELEIWLGSAQQRIRDWKEQSLNASQDLNTVRNSIRDFIAFSTEVDDKSSLKSSVVSTGNQLLLLKQSDAAMLRSALTTYDQRWADLIAQLPSIQEKLLQLQMAKLPSHEAIAELMDQMNQMEQERRAEATVNAQSPTCQVKSLLKKYKEYEMEMNFKQGVVDYVNQSLLQMTTCDVKNKRYERTVFAERLGEMNLRWHRLRGSLAGKIKELEHILESAGEKESRARSLGSWLEAQSRRLKQAGKPASSILAQDTAQDCKIALLKTSTESALEQWRIYDQAWDEVRLMLARIVYCLEVSKPPMVTFETLKTQVENLQSLQDKAESNEEIWAKLQAAACNLKKLCDPSFSEIIEQKCREARTRWTLMNKEIEDHLHKAQASLQLWESYVGLHAEVMAKVDKYEEQYGSLLADVAMLKLDLQNIKESFLPVSELADKIAQLAEPTESLLPEKLQPLQRISYLEKMLQMKENKFEFDLSQLKRFETCLENLENHVKGFTEVLENLNQGTEDSDLLMMLVLTALSPEMESLNEFSFRFPLSDFTAKRLQDLNWQWTQKKAMALEKCCELQSIQSDEKFIQRCQKWALFQEKMKEVLREDMAGSLEGLRKQQREYEVMLLTVSAPIQSRKMDLIATPSKSLAVGLETTFLSKLTLLKEQWQSIVRAAQQRKGEIDSLVKQWQKFTTSLQDIKKILVHTSGFMAAVESQEKYSLHQLRNLSHDVKKKEILLQRWQTKHALTLAAGEKLLDVANPEARVALQLKMTHVQETWSKTQLQLEKIRKQLQRTLQSGKSQTENLGNRLRELKARIKYPLPVQHAELQAAKEHVKELEKSLANWNQNTNKLGSMKGLAHYILAEDVMVLKEQVEHLHRQWEELCLRVSLRKQEIEDRLNAWIVFNEKNKELCAWLVQMESKVLQSADVSIEDMIDKLEKDCMEEISLFSENNLVLLKQMGEQLIKASNESKAAEIDEKLNKINDRWKHLFDVIGGRVKKLKETFSFIQLLNKNMSNLRTWLARIESELSKPVVYDTCDDQEIKKRLAEQQDLQRDIDQHSPDVDSVFCICEVLLNDSDACANQTECDSIQQTTRSLDRRWRNICAMSMERRMKIEETWQLWQKFLEDYSRFEDWLKTAERTAAYPNSSEVSYTNAKEDLKKFEAFQRQIHERLTQLELINKQYRRLARENRTDSASKLKQMVHKGNQDWDNLQKRVTAILRRLKHFTNQWEEFVGTKDSILVWLTEMDLQLTNVEHFSESNLDEKMRQLNCFQQEILLNTDKIHELTMSGKHLIQKSEPSDAVVIEEELQEVHRYYQDVFGRVSRFQHRLASWPPGLEDEKETSESEADMEDARGMHPWCRKAMQEVLPPQQSLCHLVPPAVGHERSGCETPVSVDSIPLEWDHTGDVGDSGPQDEEEEQYYSDLSDVEIPENAEAFLKMTTKSLKAVSEKSASETHTWHSPESPACRKHPYSQGEMVPSVLLNSPETSTPYKPGYVSPTGCRSRAAHGNRWELIQAQDLSNKLRMKQSRQQREQLNSDLTNINAWLDRTEKELEMLQEAEPPTSITAIHQRVKKQKDMLKAFDNYKALVLSANLTSKDFRQGDSAGSKELQNRLRQVNMRWEEAIHLMGEWRKSLQEALVGCQDFHKQNHNLLLWLAVAEVRRHQAQIKDLNADPHAIQESRRELMQLEKELLERQPQVNTLQEISTHLLVKSGGGDYVEAHEKVHVIGKKLKQLLERVSSDLKVSHGKQVRLGSLGHSFMVAAVLFGFVPILLQAEFYKRGTNPKKEEVNSPAAPKTRGFLSRVLRMAFPLQLLFLLLLLLATLPPFSEEDYSCAHRNNFARSFHPMLTVVPWIPFLDQGKVRKPGHNFRFCGVRKRYRS